MVKERIRVQLLPEDWVWYIDREKRKIPYKILRKISENTFEVEALTNSFSKPKRFATDRINIKGEVKLVRCWFQKGDKYWVQHSSYTRVCGVVERMFSEMVAKDRYVVTIELGISGIIREYTPEEAEKLFMSNEI